MITNATRLTCPGIMESVLILSLIINETEVVARVSYDGG